MSYRSRHSCNRSADEPGAGRDRRGAGFTLIELLVTLAVLAVLSVIVLPVAQVQITRQKEHELRYALREIRTAIDAHKKASDEGRIRKEAGATGYPPSLQALVEGVQDQRDPRGRKLYFLRRIPRDPFSPETSTDAADAWRQRSYASEADAPAPGDDIYDVFSGSSLTGLNGVPYARW